jgi:predicted nuclease of predicted toxin-antitoxin system
VKLLFDCHVAKATVGALRKVAPGIQAEHLAQWRGGAFLRAGDDEILAACHQERRVFLTYDQATVADLLRLWAAEERPHSGVVFADENTVKPNVPADVASAVAALAKEIGNADTVNLVRHLRPAFR